LKARPRLEDNGMAKHILIVDDSKTVRNLVAFIMKKKGSR
jgi:CheY-like chemotaxis protein